MRHADINPAFPKTTFLLRKGHKIKFFGGGEFSIEIDDSRNEDTGMDNEGNNINKKIRNKKRNGKK